MQLRRGSLIPIDANSTKVPILVAKIHVGSYRGENTWEIKKIKIIITLKVKYGEMKKHGTLNW